MKKGDIFIWKDNIDTLRVNNFLIFIWKDNNDYYKFQYLDNINWIEYINNGYYSNNCEVVKVERF